jgi:hypothetical protein
MTDSLQFADRNLSDKRSANSWADFRGLKDL